jgi:hypothetical protein
VHIDPGQTRTSKGPYICTAQGVYFNDLIDVCLDKAPLKNMGLFLSFQWLVPGLVAVLGLPPYGHLIISHGLCHKLYKSQSRKALWGSHLKM